MRNYFTEPKLTHFDGGILVGTSYALGTHAFETWAVLAVAGAAALVSGLAEGLLK